MRIRENKPQMRWPTWGELAFWPLFILGPPMVFWFTPGGALLAGAAALGCLSVLVAVRVAVWGWPEKLTSGVMLRRVTFVVVLVGGGSLVINNTPGGHVVAIAAFLAYASVVAALRVAVWGWRD